MTPRRQAFERLRVVLLILAVLSLGLSVFSPSIREMHTLSARLVCHLNGDTIVRGQPTGCVLYQIPNVVLGDVAQSKILADASDDADAYVLALILCPADRLPMPPATLSDHPAGLWATLQTVGRFGYWYYRDRPPTPELRRRLEELLAALEKNQPDNAAIPFAQAAMDFEANDPDAAVNSLTRAANASQWEDGAVAARRIALRLQQDRGLPMFDAAQEFEDADASMNLASLVKIGVSAYLDAAVSENRDVDFACAAELDERIWTVSWQRISSFQYWPALLDDDVLSAMASRLCGLPPSLNASRVFWYSRDNSADRVAIPYLDGFAPPELVERVVARLEESPRRIEALRRFNDRSAVFRAWGNATFGGVAAILFLAVIPGMVLLQIPFIAAAGEPRWASIIPRSGKFWILSLVMALLATAILMSAAVPLFTEPGGFRATPPTPSLVQLGYQLLGCSTTVLALFLLKLVLINPNRPVPLASIGLGAVMLLYVASTVIAAHYRTEFVQQLTLRIDPPLR